MRASCIACFWATSFSWLLSTSGGSRCLARVAIGLLQGCRAKSRKVEPLSRTGLHVAEHHHAQYSSNKDGAMREHVYLQSCAAVPDCAILDWVPITTHTQYYRRGAKPTV